MHTTKTLASAAANPVVIVVNDENLIVSTLVAVLCQNGYEAVGFTTCAQAVHQCAAIRPELALIDIVVGGGNGIDAAAEIRKRVPHCQIILMSGYPEASEMLERAQAAGKSFEVLAKPILPSELLELLDRRLRRSAA